MTEAHKIIEEYAKSTSNFKFIQIGAYDGVTGDPIFDLVTKYRWSGVLVEPQKYAFDLLVNNYRGVTEIFFENIAIGDTNGSKKFYGVKPVDYDNSNHGQLHSFNKNVILKHTQQVAGLKDRIIEYTVPTLTLQTLLQKYSLSSLDLLQIDTEGYDYEIIKQIAFDRLKPHFINFEYSHLTDSDRQECYRLLTSQGYKLTSSEYNMLAELTD